jgi:hypothetical protein
MRVNRGRLQSARTDSGSRLRTLRRLPLRAYTGACGYCGNAPFCLRLRPSSDPLLWNSAPSRPPPAHERLWQRVLPLSNSGHPSPCGRLRGSRSPAAAHTPWGPRAFRPPAERPPLTLNPTHTRPLRHAAVTEALASGATAYAPMKHASPALEGRHAGHAAPAGETSFPHFQQKRWSMRPLSSHVLHVFHSCG